MDEDGYFWYQARSDDMIISAGYNIAGPEVEAALLPHPAVAECGVVGAPTRSAARSSRPMWCCAPGHSGDAAMTTALQDHVKATIAPYKYPRAIEYVDGAAADADRQAAALRAAPHRRRATPHANSRRKGSDMIRKLRISRPHGAAAAGLAAPARLCQRHQGARRMRLRRRHGRLGREGRHFPDGFVGAGAPGACTTSSRFWPRAAPSRSTSCG